MPEATSHQANLEPRSPITAVVIANPHAGSYTTHRQQIEETLMFLRHHGWDVQLCLTQAQGDGRRFTREAVARKRQIVIAVGGDGTINEVIQELAGSKTALGVLPSGTVNVWARETGIPIDDYAGAREILVHGQTRCIDLGKVNDHYFLLMASIGFDAEVTQKVEKRPLKRFGILGYVLTGTWLGLGYPTFQVIMQIEGHAIRTRALQVVFGNTQLYAGAVKLTWQAKCDDGLLNVCVVHTRTIFDRISVVGDLLLRRPRRQQWVRYETARQVKIHTSSPVAIQADGDPMGTTAQRGYSPLTVSVVPGALKVIVPQQVSEDLFSKPLSSHKKDEKC